MTQRDFDPDVTQRDSGPFWAAALVLAIRSGDVPRAEAAREHLRRLGYRVNFTEQAQAGKAVHDDR